MDVKKQIRKMQAKERGRTKKLSKKKKKRMVDK